MNSRILALMSALFVLPAFGQEKPMLVTSDTVEYCEQLQVRVTRVAHRPAEVQRLLLEGREMCDHGEVRGGIVRLRRALLMLKRRAPGETE